VSEKWPWVLSRDIDHIDVIGVNIDRLVADNEFFERFPRISHDGDVCVGDVKLVLVLEEEFVLLSRLIFVKLDQKHSELLLVFVGEKVEEPGFVIVYDLFDVRDIE